MQLYQGRAFCIRLAYVLTWSLGLLWATFPDALSSDFGFNTQKLTIAQLTKTYIFPLIMVMALYLWDVIYEMIKTKIYNGKDRGQTGALIMIVLFLISFVLSLGTGNNGFNKVWFYIGWSALAFMKLLTTSPIITNDNIKHEAIPVPSNK